MGARPTFPFETLSAADAAPNKLSIADACGPVDHVPFALFVLNTAGEIVFRNQRAVAHAAEGGPLAIRAGRLAPRRAHAASYARALAAARGGAVMHVALTDERGRLYFLSVAPLQRDGAVCVTIVDPDAPCAEPAQIANILNISMAEAEVARALFNGARVADIARSRRVTPATVRSQLKSLFRKLDVATQAELIRLLAALPRSAPASAPRP